MKKTYIIILAVIVILALYVGGTYNGLVTRNEQVTSQWSQVENQYQRRFDLIPNLVETTKGIANQEKAVFTAIADARTQYGGAKTIDEKAQAAGQVESALGRLLVITENYPQLASSQSFRDLTASLEGTENRISVERRSYNNDVQAYNTSLKRFPASLIASMFGFNEHAYFNVTNDAANTPPKVQF